MDNSSRMKTGMAAVQPESRMPNYPPRLSAEASRNPFLDDAEDFSDVFGGPPRTILSRRLSTDFSRSYSSTSFFYQEIFRPLERASPPHVRRNGRSLPQFRIPGSNSKQDRHGKDFYSDVFGWVDEAAMKLKTSSSSALSPEELSPIRAAVSGDGSDDFAFFASKLRPINVRFYSRHEDNKSQRTMPPVAGNRSNYNTENDQSQKLRSYPFGFNPSPEIVSLEPASNSSFRISADDLEHNYSPSSAVSSLYKEQRAHIIMELMPKQDALEQEEDEVMSSFVIEINSDDREGTSESNGVDEAIAWAKEKFQMHFKKREIEPPTEEVLKGHELSNVHADTFESLDVQPERWDVEEEAPQFKSMIPCND